MKVGLLTVSDRAAAGDYVDQSGPLLTEIIEGRTAWQVVNTATVPDELDQISRLLLEWCDAGLNLVLTTGGTGFAPRDITPEATRAVIEREAPGIVEALRAESLKITRHAMLSRAIAGIHGRTLIVNLPGSPKAVRESMDILLPVLPHALDLLEGAEGSEHEHRAV